MENSNKSAGLQQALESNEVVMVKFIKSNGDERKMNCVINPKVVGVEWDYKGGTSAPADFDADLQIVFDVDIKEFRKFHLSSVTEWSITH